MDYIMTPDGNTLYDGTIVTIARFPGMKWVLHRGFYTFEGRRCNGWHFISIPDNSAIPMYDADLIGLQIVGSTGSRVLTPYSNNTPPVECCPHPFPSAPPYPPYPPYPPCPPPVYSYPYTARDRDTVFKAAMTVENMYELDMLKTGPIPNGKIVRVNDFGGSVEYFEWSAATKSWELLSLGSRYPDADQIENTYATKAEVNTLEDQINEMSTTVQEAVEQVNTVSEHVDEISGHVDEVSDQVDQVSGQVGQVSEQVDEVSDQVGQVSEHVDQVSTHVDEVSEDLDELAEQVDALSDTVSGVQEDLSHFNWIDIDDMED